MPDGPTESFQRDGFQAVKDNVAADSDGYAGEEFAKFLHFASAAVSEEAVAVGVPNSRRQFWG